MTIAPARYSLAVVSIATVVMAMGSACSSKQATSEVPGTTTAASSTEPPATTDAPTTREPEPATTRPTTSSPTSSPAAADRLGGIGSAELDLLDHAGAYRRFRTVSDDTGQARVEVPATWQVDTGVRTIQGTDGPSILAAEDLQDWKDGRSTPSVRIAGYEGALKDKGIDWALGHEAEVDRITDCIGASERFAFEARGYKGTSVVTARCGPHGRDVVVHLAALPDSGDGDLFVLGANLVTDADVEALARAIDTFEVPRS